MVYKGREPKKILPPLLRLKVTIANLDLASGLLDGKRKGNWIASSVLK